MRARFDVAVPIRRFLESFYDDATGGFYGTREQRQQHGEQEMMSSGLAATALLWAGRTDMALHTAQWIKNVWESQPNLRDGLYFVWHHSKGLVTSFPAAAAKSYVVNAKELAQRYYQYGIPAAFLSSLSGQTGDRAWLDLGCQFLHALELLPMFRLVGFDVRNVPVQNNGMFRC